MLNVALRFEVTAIAEAELDRIRVAGHDDHGNLFAPRMTAPGEDGAPLRCCLQDSRVGERVAVISYGPPSGRGAYAEVGPVFIHADRCGGYTTPDRFPPGFASRQQVLRTYDENGKISDALIVSGGSADPVIAHLLSRSGVVSVESHNVLFGCYMFTARRAA
jgi:Protein of unknown function (DUF1203)